MADDDYNDMDMRMNALVRVELEGETDPLEIAMKELRERKFLSPSAATCLTDGWSSVVTAQ